MSSKKKPKQKNLVAKHAHQFNKYKYQPSDKSKLKSKRVKQEKVIDEDQ